MLASAFGLVMLAPALAHADVTDPSQLKSLKEEFDTSLERKKVLEAQSEAAAKEVAETRAKLISTAAKVQAGEAEVSASEVRLNDLNTAEAELLKKLEKHRANIATLLGALARLDRNPPPALAVKPDDALGAIRSAILMGEAVPELKTEAENLKTKLDDLLALRQQIVAERETLAAAAASLKRERAALEKLLDRKVARQKKLDRATENEEARAARLSREATDLTDLIDRLESRAQSRLPQSRPEPAPLTKPAPRPVLALPDHASSKESKLVLLTPPSAPAKLPSSRHFSEAKGLLRLPATGLLVSGFGEPNGVGGHTQGMTIATRPGAEVVAPFDGKIVFAGPFRRYGQLLILSVGEGYYVLLAGMAEIDGSVGQSVLAGEPVGRMSPDEGGNFQPSSVQNANSRQKTATDGRPSLYIEFRKDSDPIDPRPWLMMRDKKARG
jgi:septal ring factor EnvC (AmiA/AmiB activator)